MNLEKNWLRATYGVIYESETWTLGEKRKNMIEACETWMWRTMERIKMGDKAKK